MDEHAATTRPVGMHVNDCAHLQFAGEAHGRIRQGFSVPNALGAQHFAEQLKAHEEAHAGEPFGAPWDKARWYASAAILLSFAAIEAVLDETQDDLKIPDGKIPERGKFWDRVRAILLFAEAEGPELGHEPFRSADLLASLRNGLAHPKAEWSDALRTHRTLTRQIIGRRLPLSPFIPDPATAFPLGCMSAGVADWAADTARQFIREFRQRCGLIANV